MAMEKGAAQIKMCGTLFVSLHSSERNCEWQVLQIPKYVKGTDGSKSSALLICFKEINNFLFSL